MFWSIRKACCCTGSRELTAEPNPKVLEGEWAGVNNVIIEFPDMDAVERWHKSDEYKPLLELRLGITRGNLVAFNGT